MKSKLDEKWRVVNERYYTQKYSLLVYVSYLLTTFEIFNAISFCDLNKSIILIDECRINDYCYSRLLKKKGIER